MIFQDHRVTVSQMLDKDTLKSFQESGSKSVYAGNSSINRLDTSEVSRTRAGGRGLPGVHVHPLFLRDSPKNLL